MFSLLNKIVLVFVLFCATTLITNAEPIKDKDFEDFFNNKILQPLQKNYWVNDIIIGFDAIVDEEYVCKNNLVEYIVQFAEYLEKCKKTICKLSSKNKYYAKGTSKCDNCWIGYGVSGVDDTEEAYGVKNVYELCFGGDGDCGYSSFVFGKKDGKWTLVGRGGVG